MQLNRFNSFCKQDWANNDNDPSPEGNGHGTAASGIIAAATNNNGGVAGICWECRIMCLKFIDAINGRVSNQVSAIDYAAKMGARISNNSYGGYGHARLNELCFFVSPVFFFSGFHCWNSK